MNIYYKIRFKSEIETLNLEIRRSECKGLLIPKKHFFTRNKENNHIEIDENYIKTIQALDKDIILYENYYSMRTSLLDPSKFKDNKFKSNILKKKESYENIFNPDNIENYLLSEINEYFEIIKYVEILKNNKKISEIEQKLFRKRENFKIQSFTLPYLPKIPSKYNNESAYYHSISEFNSNAIENIKLYIKKYSKEYNLNNHLFTVSLIMEDFLANNDYLNEILNEVENFKRVGLWIIDFNDLIATRKEISSYKKIVSLFNEKDISLFIYYSGAYSSKLLVKINPKINKIVRISGYPGLNINIPSIVPRTKRFLYQGNGNFYNPNNFAQELLKKQSRLKFQCRCDVCKNHKINNPKRIYDFYIQNPKDNPDYNIYHGRADKTLEQKLKTKQNSFLIKHNFYNLDYQLHLSPKKFYEIFFINNNGLPNWKAFIKPEG